MHRDTGTAVVSAKILRYHGAPNCPVMEHVTEHTAFLRQSFFLKFRIEYWKYVLAAAA